MRTIFALLLVLALAAMCSGRSMDTEVRRAAAPPAPEAEDGDDVGEGAAITPLDCKTLPTIPGVCEPRKCNLDCQDGLGHGYSVGECVKDGCKCTYCIPGN